MKIATQEIIDFLKIAYDGAVELDKRRDHGVAYLDSVSGLLAVVIDCHPEPVVRKFALNILNELEGKGKHAHLGDPCIYCGTPHDEVGIGDCPGNRGRFP